MIRKMKKMQWYVYLLIVYFLASNIFAIAVTVHDKKAARKKYRRISEKNLLITAALSGCITMYVTMHIIHHKTRKPKFMVGIPVILIVEILAFLGIAYLCKLF